MSAGDDRRMVKGAVPRSAQTPGGDVRSVPLTPAARRPLTADELHAKRVAWGRLWGARISEATKQWKGEL